MRHALCALTGVVLLAAGCGNGDDPPRRPKLPTGAGEVSGSGFVTRQPQGYTGAGTGQPTGVVLTLLGASRGTAGKPPTIIVVRSPRLPRATPRKLRSVLRDQVEGMGGRQVKTLPHRQIDGDPAVGVASRRTATGSAETVERSYRVVHADAIYSVASSVLVRDQRSGERALEAVLDGWKWTR